MSQIDKKKNKGCFIKLKYNRFMTQCTYKAIFEWITKIRMYQVCNT